MRVYLVFQEHHYRYGYFKQTLEAVYANKKDAQDYINNKMKNPNSNYRYIKTKEIK